MSARATRRTPFAHPSWRVCGEGASSPRRRWCTTKLDLCGSNRAGRDCWATRDFTGAHLCAMSHTHTCQSGALCIACVVVCDMRRWCRKSLTTTARIYICTYHYLVLVCVRVATNRRLLHLLHIDPWWWLLCSIYTKLKPLLTIWCLDVFFMGKARAAFQ